MRVNAKPWLSWAISGAVTALWLAVIVISDLEARVVENWEAALTMLFGSFLAGSSPEGGGAVAFPVFTKVLGVPGPIARTFGLSIQAVGMSMAAIAIFLSRRPVHVRALVVATPAAVAGFLGALFLLSDRDDVFWAPTIGSAWVKATFSVVFATTSILMIRRLRSDEDPVPELAWSPRLGFVTAILALAGGALSSLTGTGANIAVFLGLVVVAGVAPKTALPTALIVMAAVSIVGVVVLGVIDGQLDVVTAAGRVIEVGGQPTDLDAGSADLLGLWLSALPVVVWGAPLGSLAAALIEERVLVRFIALLAAIEVMTTFLLVPELRTEWSLIAYLVGGLLVLPAMFVYFDRRRLELFGIG